MLSPRLSSQNFTSRVLTSAYNDVNYEEMSDEELRSAFEEAMRTCRTLTLENDVFERYLRRRDPEYLEKLPQIIESARQAQRITSMRPSQFRSSQAGSIASFASSMGYEKTSSMLSVVSNVAPTGTSSFSNRMSLGGAKLPKHSTKGPKITVRHRIELADKEVEDMKKMFDNFEKGVRKKRDDLKAQLELMKYRMAEVKDSAAQLETEVLRYIDPITNKVPAERLARYMEDQLKLAGTIIDKCNLGLVTSKRLIKETRISIARRKDVGNTLRPIDFEQLKIENAYLIEENDVNTVILKGLKRISGHYNRVSKNHKEKLIERKSQVVSTEKELILKKHENLILRRTKVRERHEVDDALAQLNYIKELREEYEIPDVLEFLDTKRQLLEARKNMKRLNRQRKIQLFKLQSCRVLNLHRIS